jgi:hypothetical protein
MKVSFIVALLTVGYASAATRGLKGVESGMEGKSAQTRTLKKMGKKSSKGKSACFETVYGAAAIGNKMLADFWGETHHYSCEPVGIAKAMRVYFAEDVTIAVDGTTIIEGIDDTVAAFVGADGIVGSLTDLCLNHFVSWTAALVTSSFDNTFVFSSNELTSPQAAVGLPVGMLPMSTFFESSLILVCH